MLRTLHQIAVADKHRLMVPTIFGAELIHMEREGMKVPIRISGKREPIEDGSVLAIVPASQWPELKVGQQATVTLTVTFDDRCGGLRWKSIDDGMLRLQTVTAEAIETLETCL